MRKISRLAFYDYRHEWRNSVCLIISIATVLGPVLVLFGLKYGIVGGMINSLIEEPRNREITPISSGRFNQAWFEALAKRKDVEFVIPRTRSIATVIELKSRNSGRILDAQLISTGPGDPLLPEVSIPPVGNYEVLILSSTLAQKLNVSVGDSLDGSIARRFRGKIQRVHLQLTVQAIVSDAVLNQDTAFSSLALLEALENYRDGLRVPELGWSGDKKLEARYYPSFRLFARTIYEVANLRDWFLEQGIEIHTRAHDIEVVQRLDQNLSILYWAVAITGIGGCILSLGANFWSNIERKRKELSVLRLVGFNSLDIMCFPVVQGFLTALAGWLLAIAIYQVTSLSIREFMADRLERGQQVCLLVPRHYMISLLIICGSVMIVAAGAGFKAARVETADGLREQ